MGSTVYSGAVVMSLQWSSRDVSTVFNTVEQQSSLYSLQYSGAVMGSTGQWCSGAVQWLELRSCSISLSEQPLQKQKSSSFRHISSTTVSESWKMLFEIIICIYNKYVLFDDIANYFDAYITRCFSVFCSNRTRSTRNNFTSIQIIGRLVVVRPVLQSKLKVIRMSV